MSASAFAQDNAFVLVVAAEAWLFVAATTFLLWVVGDAERAVDNLRGST